MNTASEANRQPAPWHYWPLAIAALLWSSIGVIDFVATNADVDFYLRDMGGMSDADIAFFQSYPLWHKALWMMGAWGALFGAILLLVKNRFAVAFLAASLIGAVLSNGVMLTKDNLPEIVGGFVFPGIITAICLATLAYAIWMRRRSVLV